MARKGVSDRGGRLQQAVRRVSRARLESFVTGMIYALYGPELERDNDVNGGDLVDERVVQAERLGLTRELFGVDDAK